jgi:hypothetical protein
MTGAEEPIERFPTPTDSLLKMMVSSARLAGNGAEFSEIE